MNVVILHFTWYPVYMWYLSLAFSFHGFPSNFQIWSAQVLFMFKCASSHLRKWFVRRKVQTSLSISNRKWSLLSLAMFYKLLWLRLKSSTLFKCMAVFTDTFIACVLSMLMPHNVTFRQLDWANMMLLEILSNAHVITGTSNVGYMMAINKYFWLQRNSLLLKSDKGRIPKQKCSAEQIQ